MSPPSTADKALDFPNDRDVALSRPFKLPRALQLLLLVLLSLTLSSLLYSFTAGYTHSDLASVSRRLEQWWEVGALVGLRIFELGLGWALNYDSYDLTSLTILSHAPTLYLLREFYNIQSSTIISSLLIDCLTAYIPFRLLRPLSQAHAASSFSPAVQVPNREIVTDFSIQTIITLLAATIYSLVLYSAFVSRLPIYLVTYFTDIPSIETAYRSSLISLLPITLLFGLVSKSFIFTPAVATTSPFAEPPFDPITATLSETFWYNIWGGYSRRTQVAAQRTVVLTLICGVNTFAQSVFTIEGVEVGGAVIYSGLWVLAASMTGIVLGVVGAV